MSDSKDPFAGIKYESRFGHGLDLWAIFERAQDASLDQSYLLEDISAEAIRRNDPSFIAALQLHRLELD